MNKKLIIYIVIGIITAIAISICLLFILKDNKSNQEDLNIVITSYENSDNPKSLKLEKKFEIKKITDFIQNLNKRENPKFALRNDFEINYNNEMFFYLQSDIEDYCFYKNSKTNESYFITMPKDILNFVKQKLSK